MADIKKSLILEDKFTTTFDRFIAKTEYAETLMDNLTEGTESLADQLEELEPVSESSLETVESLASEAAESVGDLVDRATTFTKVIEAAGNKGETALKKTEKAVERTHKKTHRLSNFLGTIVSAAQSGISKVTNFIEEGLERAPDRIAKPWKKLKTNVIDNIARFSVSMLSGMKAGVDRLNKAFESPAGVRLIKFLQVGFNILGQVVGFVAGKVAEFVEFLGNQITNTGDAFADLFEFLGGLFGGAYVVVHNAVATLWNLTASFAEFLGNAFNDPLGSVMHLVIDVANAVLDVVAWAAKGIDKLLGTDLASGIKDFQNNITDWVDTKYGPKAFNLDRMEMITFEGTVGDFSERGRKLGEKLSAASLEKEKLQTIKAIKDDTYAIRDAITDEDLKMLIDMATRRFISNVNLTAQTPVITINGANTGNTEADRKALARAIRDILVDQLASNSTTGYYAYEGV